MDTIKKLRSKISDVKFDNPPGIHGGLGSTTAHNELLALIDGCSSYENFVKSLNNWAQDRLVSGISGLPKGLRR